MIFAVSLRRLTFNTDYDGTDISFKTIQPMETVGRGL